MEVGRAVAVPAEGRELAPAAEQNFGGLVAAALARTDLAYPPADAEEVMVRRARAFQLILKFAVDLGLGLLEAPLELALGIDCQLAISHGEIIHAFEETAGRALGTLLRRLLRQRCLELLQCLSPLSQFKIQVKCTDVYLPGCLLYPRLRPCRQGISRLKMSGLVAGDCAQGSRRYPCWPADRAPSTASLDCFHGRPGSCGGLATGNSSSAIFLL